MNATLDDSYRFCADVSRREAKNFYYSFLLLPRDRRRSMCALYGFMRRTDDLADAAKPVEIKESELAVWRGAVEAALDGRGVDPDVWPELPALADTVARHEIPREFLREVLDGVAMDLRPRPFATFDELYAYCYRVASVVGMSCLYIWGFRPEDGRALQLAESCGVALQLTNILRDVREDAANGRVYLPGEDLASFGVTNADLLASRPSAGLRALLAFEGRRAYEYYESSRPLQTLVAPVGRPVLGAIVGIYRALLDEIARRDYDVLASRLALPKWRKAAIALGSIAGRFA